MFMPVALCVSAQHLAVAARACAEASPVVRRLITLGAPHLPPPDPKKDMTGGALGWVHEQYPGTQNA
jgi:hypothetical protein